MAFQSNVVFSPIFAADCCQWLHTPRILNSKWELAIINNPGIYELGEAAPTKGGIEWPNHQLPHRVEDVDVSETDGNAVALVMRNEQVICEIHWQSVADPNATTVTIEFDDYTNADGTPKAPYTFDLLQVE